MNNDDNQQFEDEIRNYKLYKISLISKRIKEYKDVLYNIKQNIVIKQSKNITSNIIAFVFYGITIVFLIIGIYFQFPENFIELINENGEAFNNTDKQYIKDELPIFGYIILFLSVLFFVISKLLRKNLKKRNKIYDLSILVNDVIEYLEENNREDKRKYEYFVDNIAEKQARKKTENQTRSHTNNQQKDDENKET